MGQDDLECATAAEAAQAMARAYEVYESEVSEIQSKPVSAKDYFVNYFTGRRPETPANESFLAQMQRLTARLEELLRQEAPETAERITLQVLARMLAPKPIPAQGDSRVLMLIGVEQLAQPLLPYLGEEQLRGVREAYLRNNPKRKMYPKQRELLAAMDRRLERKDGR